MCAFVLWVFSSSTNFFNYLLLFFVLTFQFAVFVEIFFSNTYCNKTYISHITFYHELMIQQRHNAGTSHVTTSLKLHNDFVFSDFLLSWYLFCASACHLFFSVNLSLTLQSFPFTISTLSFKVCSQLKKFSSSAAEVITLGFNKFLFVKLCTKGLKTQNSICLYTFPIIICFMLCCNTRYHLQTTIWYYTAFWAVYTHESKCYFLTESLIAGLPLFFSLHFWIFCFLLRVFFINFLSE